jgi:hypothetical protein
LIQDSVHRKFRSWILPSLWTFLAIVLTSVHVYVTRKGSAYAGYLLVADHIFEISLALVFLAVCLSVGGTALDRFNLRFDKALDEALFSTAVGSGIVATILFVCEFLLGTRTGILTLVAALVMVFARARLMIFPRLLARAYFEFKERTGIWSRFTLVIVGLFMISQAIAPATDWDSLMYHLRVPTQFLERGRIFVPEDNFHVAYVQLIHTLYLPLLDAGSPAGPALLSVFFAVLLGVSVFAFADRFFQASTASFSLVLLWSSTMVLLVAITPRVDVTLAYFLLLAHFALFMAWTDWRFFYLAAVLLGFAFGVKYNALLYLAALSPLIVYVTICKTRDIGRMVRHLTIFSLVFICTSSPWILKNWLLLKAPLYPFFVRMKINSWLAFLYPDQVFSESLNHQILTMLGQVRSPLNLLDLYLNPTALTVEHEAMAYHLNPLFLFLPFWFVLMPKTRTLNWLLIPPLGYLCVLILFSPKTNLRYIIPVIAPLTIVAVHFTVLHLTRILGERRLMVAMFLISLVVLWPMTQAVRPWTVNKKTLAYLTGLSSREDYLINNVFPPDYYPAAQVVSYVNQHLKRTSRILMLFEARGFYFKVPVIQDNVLVNWPLLANKLDSVGCLEPAGISHVLVNGGVLSFYLGRGLDPDVVQWKRFQEFADRCLSPVYQGVGHTLYEVKNRNS